MGYIEWISHILIAVVKVTSDQGEQALWGVMPEDVALAANAITERSQFDDMEHRPVNQAVVAALFELETLGAATRSSSSPRWKLTQEGRRFAQQGLPSEWKKAFKPFLTDEQTDFLRSTVELAQEPHENYSVLGDVSVNAVCERLGWEWQGRICLQGESLTRELEEAGMAKRRGRAGDIRILPTYLGVVRSTQQEQTALHKMIEERLATWENPICDFKIEVNLTTKAEKAKFVREILALATTNTGTSDRYLIIGFDNGTRQFAKSVDPSLKQEQLEQILTEYTEPEPSIRYHRVQWNTGMAGLIVIMRDQTKVPYRVKRELGDTLNPGSFSIRAGQVFVRHGSHSKAATKDEIASLEEEATVARSKSPG